MNEKIDILAFGAHADDVEIGMGASIAKWSSEGKSVVICDLTEAELSSNGTVANRKKEAIDAANLLGVKERVSLTIPDRGLYINNDHIQKVVEIIRTYKPSIIFAPYFEDRHPDHGNCAYLVKEAVFSAGIRKFTTGLLEAHKAKNLYYYMINGFHKPDFVIDITSFMEHKVASLNAYQSQFVQMDNGVKTPLTEGYIESVKARERMFGKEVGVTYGEGFKVTKPLLLNMDVLGE
ncbi:bacillithiol biosynthesis deacetylase BshB1 [Heyndrickxia vini]|uniref:Bacillithiol biosynthesis deacetylase BshB1 n=1 Tax=Heyndrickxia vini TaxID=1476025 RepID=A0ABX7E637_9BACI|nr:bacillithiol biosynthesis deacetylase BshB1 [Heyndrickxia vini]QQZ11046.1 bacillithiol biosynthesis deacetylase BshB1 [Heyndrickxia vini]